jgi:hypothetical protein
LAGGTSGLALLDLSLSVLLSGLGVLAPAKSLPAANGIPATKPNAADLLSSSLLFIESLQCCLTLPVSDPATVLGFVFAKH